MLIFLNTFDECQTDKSPSPFLSLPLCLLVSLFHILSPLLFCPCFHFLGWDIWNQWIYLHPSLIWIIEYSSAYCVVTRHPYYKQPEQWDVLCSQWKTDALCHVCNDRQQSAFRVPTFIIVNVDDTGLLPSWQTVKKLSGLHNHWLFAAMITFKLINANHLGMRVPVWVGRQLCMYVHVCLSAPRHRSCPRHLVWTLICHLSHCWRQRNLDGDQHNHNNSKPHSDDAKMKINMLFKK